uniref:Uncharacterized protein n=1 Tax=Arundo donax TaxID=35708 RepID=A0A0A8YAU5_ARUDO
MHPFPYFCKTVFFLCKLPEPVNCPFHLLHTA